MSFFGKIDFNELSETDRAIYHFMSSNSDKIPYMRVRDIAKESHTSASSVMRFIRKIGYESFTEFRTQFKVPTTDQEDLLAGKEALERQYFPKNIEATIWQIAEKILESENIIFFGMGVSGSMCDYAARRFATVGCNSFALTDPTYPISGKLFNTTDNVFITLSITGMTTEIVEVVNGFRNRGDYTIVAITGDVNSTLAQMSDHVLSYQTTVKRIHHYEDLTTQIPAVFLIESLAEAVYRLTKKESH